MRKQEIEVLRGQMEQASKWTIRAVIMSKVLEHLGYSTANVMNADKEILAGYVYREPVELIHCLQMKGGVRYPPLELYRYAGKIGPWARRGSVGIRFLATGLQKKPVYKRIALATKDGDSWHYLVVRLEGEIEVRSCWCGTNTYEEAA